MVKSLNCDNRTPYERPAIRKAIAEQASLFLVGHAYIGNRAKELLELVFPERMDSGLPST
jgi:hypothetical protein